MCWWSAYGGCRSVSAGSLLQTGAFSLGQPLPWDPEPLYPNTAGPLQGPQALSELEARGPPLASQPEEVPFPEHTWGSCVPLSPQRSLLWSVGAQEHPISPGASVNLPIHGERRFLSLSHRVPLTIG